MIPVTVARSPPSGPKSTGAARIGGALVEPRNAADLGHGRDLHPAGPARPASPQVSGVPIAVKDFGSGDGSLGHSRGPLVDRTETGPGPPVKAVG